LQYVTTQICNLKYLQHIQKFVRWQHISAGCNTYFRY
jgi:hypothetical protein